VRLADARCGRAGLGSKSFGQIANGSDYYRQNAACVEHLLSRSIQSESRHEVPFRIVFDDLARNCRVAGDFSLANKGRTVFSPNPDNHGTATPNALCLPGRGLRLNEYPFVWRNREPDRRRCALIAVFTHGGDIQNAGSRKCVHIALGKLSTFCFWFRAPFRKSVRHRDGGQNRQKAKRERTPNDCLPRGERVRDNLYRVAAASNVCPIHCYPCVGRSRRKAF
jgi:hypothetical protein